MRRPGHAAALALVAWCGCGGGGPSGDAGDAARTDGASQRDDGAADDARVDATDGGAPETGDGGAEASADGAPAEVERPLGAPWKAPVAIDKIPAGNAHGPVEIAMDAAGHAIAVWLHSDKNGGLFSLEANRFDPVTREWGLPITLETDESSSAREPDLAVDQAGNAIVVWVQDSAFEASVWSNWYDAANDVWHDAVLVERDDTGEALGPRVAALPDGGAVAIWQQFDGLRMSVWANRFEGGKWTGRALLETTDSANANQSGVAADPNGNAVAVWRQTDGSEETVWSSTRPAGADRWGAPFMLGPAGRVGGTNSPEPTVALAANGDGLALWALRKEDSWGIWSSRYRAATTTFDAAVRVDDQDDDDSTQPRLALDARGTAFATWRRSDGLTDSTWASRLAGGAEGWDEPALLDRSTRLAVNPTIAAGGDGHAVASWLGVGTFYDVFASRFDPKSGLWDLPARLDAQNTPAESPAAAIDAAGNAMVIWAQFKDDWSELWLAYQPAE
jgi:hypothetical protein